MAGAPLRRLRLRGSGWNNVARQRYDYRTNEAQVNRVALADPGGNVVHRHAFENSTLANMALLLLMGGVTSCASPADPRPVDSELVVAVATQTAGMIPHNVVSDEPYVRACPLRGQLVAQGSSSIAADDYGSVHTWNLTIKAEGCAFNLNGADVMTDGMMDISATSHFGAPVDGFARLLSQQAEQVGSMTTSRDGQQVTCDYAVTIAYNASEDDGYHVTGSACGQSVDMRTPTIPA